MKVSFIYFDEKAYYEQAVRFHESHRKEFNELMETVDNKAIQTETDKALYVQKELVRMGLKEKEDFTQTIVGEVIHIYQDKFFIALDDGSIVTHDITDCKIVKDGKHTKPSSDGSYDATKDETPISKCYDLSVRVRNICYRNRIATLGELFAIDESKLLRIRDFGRESLREIREFRESLEAKHNSKDNIRLP